MNSTEWQNDLKIKKLDIELLLRDAFNILNRIALEKDNRFLRIMVHVLLVTNIQNLSRNVLLSLTLCRS